MGGQRKRGHQPGSAWTIETLGQHSAALRAADAKFQEERDRRYAEVALEREKALKIKETADLAALQLAREIQTYKDEKANELREQINSERGLYASKDDVIAAVEKMEAAIKPLQEYIAAQQGRTGGRGDSTRNLVTVVGLVLAALAIAVSIVVGAR